MYLHNKLNATYIAYICLRGIDSRSYLIGSLSGHASAHTAKGPPGLDPGGPCPGGGASRVRLTRALLRVTDMSEEVCDLNESRRASCINCINTYITTGRWALVRERGRASGC